MEKKYTFFNTGVGILPVVAMLAVTLAGGALTPMFFTAINAQNVWLQFALMTAVGCAVAVSLRAKGPDFSIGAVMSLTMLLMAQFYAQGYGWEAGFVVALLIAAGIGLANGVVALYTPVPAPAMTLIVLIVLRSIVSFVDMTMVPVQRENAPLFAQSPLGASIFLLAVSVPVFMLVLFSRLGTPFYKRQKGEKNLAYLFAYIVSAVLAAVASLFMFSRFQVAVSISNDYVMYIVFVAAGIYASRAFDNRILPVLYTFVLAFLWVIMANVMNLVALTSFVQDILVRLPLVAGMAVLAFFTSEWKLWKKGYPVDVANRIQ